MVLWDLVKNNTFGTMIVGLEKKTVPAATHGVEFGIGKKSSLSWSIWTAALVLQG